MNCSPADGGPSWRMSEGAPKAPVVGPGAFFRGTATYPFALGWNLLLLLGAWRGRFGEIVRKPLPDLCHLE
jgi:hypothetical protein